jgi:hypothetical protein
VKYYFLSFVRNATKRYRREAFIAVGVEIRSKGKKWRSTYPNASLAVMETASVLLTKVGFAIFVRNLTFRQKGAEDRLH